MKTKRIIHIADIYINPNSGMGRVGYHWKKAFEQAGFEFIHIGKEEIPTNHPSQFPSRAKAYFLKHFEGKADVILAHEPISGCFTQSLIPVVLFSHGIEQREWDLRKNKFKKFYEPLSLKSRLLFPLWRLRNCNKGLRKSRLLLLSNSEDKTFAINNYKRSAENIFIFRNGIYSDYFFNSSEKQPNRSCTIAFNGTWIKRKGIDLIKNAAIILNDRNISVNWLLFGVVFPEEEVLKSFPGDLSGNLNIVSSYSPEEEKYLYEKGDVFVLPSFFEGQSLALLQAMASKMCCVTSSCCAQIDIIEHRKNGLLFETGNVKDLADQLQTAVEDHKLRNQLALNARASVEDRDWDVVSNEVVQAVNSLL